MIILILRSHVYILNHYYVVIFLCTNVFGYMRIKIYIYIYGNYCLFLGPNCDTCTDNYFGSPKDVNGTCEPCICNNNIDPNIPGSCDTSSGECLKCLFNTEGFNCEQCSTGFYGDATIQNCARKFNINRINICLTV